MMMRKLVISAAFAVASVVGLTSPASAQSYGGITLSIGSGGYGGYGYDDDYYDQRGYYGYDSRRASRYDYYDNSRYDWRARQRYEQLRRWQQQEQRRRYWQQQRREHHRWQNEYDGD